MRLNFNLSALTGRVRYRPTWRGKIVLQVEYEQQEWGGGQFNPSRPFPTERHWRDATWEDVDWLGLRSEAKGAK